MEIIVLILVVLGLLCFAGEALPNVAVARWNLVSAGLFCVTLAILLSDTVFRTGVNF